MMHGQGKSDGPIVPGKPPNKPAGAGAEGVEGRGSAEGNPQERTMRRTQGRERMQQALARVRQAATQDRKMRFTALLHHVYNPDTLREAYYGLKRDAAPGLDGVTWRDYGEHLEENLQDLAGRLKRGAYRAKPTRRAYIDKSDGRQRPLGVMVLEDKIVQRATVEVLNAIYEVDFLGFTHICGKKRINGYFTVYRQTMRKRLQAKLAEVKAELRHRMCRPVPELGKWLSTVLTGHYRYYGVPMNAKALWLFRYRMGRLWRRALSRRSQKGRVPWERMARFIDRHLPKPRVCHDYPLRRCGVIP